MTFTFISITYNSATLILLCTTWGRLCTRNMMTSSNGNTFRVTGWPFVRGESIGHRWIPLTKASGVGLWCFLWSTPEQTVEQNNWTHSRHHRCIKQMVSTCFKTFVHLWWVRLSYDFDSFRCSQWRKFRQNDDISASDSDHSRRKILCDTTHNLTWWRHQMETFSALLAICAGNSPVPGEFPTQRPVTRSFEVFFHLRLN